MILTLALVIPEREVFKCVRGDSMSTSLEKMFLIAHINARMMIFGDCVQTVRRRCRQFRIGAVNKEAWSQWFGKESPERALRAKDDVFHEVAGRA